MPVATMATTENVSPESLYRLMAWMSPAYPTGAYSYSHGIETAVAEGMVRDRATLVAWCEHILRHGAGWVDAVLLTQTYDAAAADDWVVVADLAELAAAMRGTREAGLESVQQGAAFLTATRAAWPDVRLDKLMVICEGQPLALPIAVAVAAVGRVPKTFIVAAYLQSFAANLISAAVRLIPLGQTDGQRAIADLAPIVASVSSLAIAADVDDLGTAAPMVDWTGMFHETQHTRLFRS
jgi:urease accessory protein